MKFVLEICCVRSSGSVYEFCHGDELSPGSPLVQVCKQYVCQCKVVAIREQMNVQTKRGIRAMRNLTLSNVWLCVGAGELAAVSPASIVYSYVPFYQRL